jgi:hypothetical protein
MVLFTKKYFPISVLVPNFPNMINPRLTVSHPPPLKVFRPSVYKCLIISQPFYMLAYHILPNLVIATFSEECRIRNLAFSCFSILLSLLIFGTLFSNTSKSLH